MQSTSIRDSLKKMLLYGSTLKSEYLHSLVDKESCELLFILHSDTGIPISDLFYKYPGANRLLFYWGNGDG